MARATTLFGADAAADALIGSLNQAVAGAISGLLDLPVEEAAIEALEGWAVGTGDLEPGDCWLCHRAFLLFS
jgi:hypothetical protein